MLQSQNGSQSSCEPSMPLLETQLVLEKARVRDLLRYYTPSRTPPATQKLASFLPIDCDVDICDEPQNGSPSTDAVAQAEEDVPDDSMLLAHDPTLMAFTQLGAYKLNCQRSFISLIDSEHQYILAESTKSVSLENPKQYDKSDPGEKIYLGPRVLDMHWGVCPNTIRVFTSLDDTLNVSTDIVSANKDFYVMNDLSAIPAYADRPYVAGWPFMRFYAEVPIHSPTGHVIGTYCVVDDKPRNGLDPKGLADLNEISASIMKHLTLVRMQQDLQRTGEMVKGLSMFVEGKSKSQDLWNGKSVEQVGEPNQRSGRQVQPPGTVRTMSASSNSQTSGSNQTEKRPTIRHTSTSESFSTSSEAQNTHALEATSVFSVAGQKTVKAGSTTSSGQRKGSSTDNGNLRSGERTLSMDGISETRESIASSGARVLFPRACELIRDAIDLDGIVIVDACFRHIAVEHSTEASRIVSEPPQFPCIPETPEIGPDKKEWLEDHIRFTGRPDPPTTDSSPSKSPTRNSGQRISVSDVIGYSLRGKARLGGVSSSLTQIPLPQSTLRGMLRHHRKGRIFFFEEDGTLAQNAEELRRRYMQEKYPDDHLKSAGPDRTTEEVWATHLRRVCSGARAIIFFPLWNPQRDQWFAGGLAWTNDPKRILQPEDITYLSAFGSCIMVEWSRLEALTADRAKSDFISSVSHELRSPLHGVLASAEALQETSTGFVQDDLIRTIAVCGELLLDTMDQILEYAKISNQKPIQASGEAQRKSEPQLSKTVALDLSRLVESVVEGILAGHYRKVALDQQIKTLEVSTKDHSTVFSSPTGDIIIILSIDWQDSWIFNSQIAGWKRILMNLFGNALKYTQEGFVHISLRCRHDQTLSKTLVTLQIDDSGRGMSKDYMKYELFTPFAQEDQMNVGTGLGLSIVRQLVTDLGGTIDIQSEKDCGTSTKVVIPLESIVTPEPELLENFLMISDIRTRCKGLTVCLVGFEYYPELGDTPTGILSAHAQRMLALKASTATYAAEWFAMNVTTAPSLESADGDILIGLHSKLDFSGESWKGRPLIVFEDTVPTHHLDRKEPFSISQPVGPSKMARTLVKCLDYISSSKAKEVAISAPDTSTLNPNIVSLVEDTNQKSMQSSKVLNTTNGATQALPLRPMQQLQTDSTTPLGIPRRSRVLLVEDNIINMKILMNYMKTAKQQFVTAANGLEALRHYEGDPQSFKLVFMDISMPIMDGLTSSQRMRLYERENRFPRTRIVALTCFSSEEYQRNAFLSGIDLFLIKPVPMKSLKLILELDPDDVLPRPT